VPAATCPASPLLCPRPLLSAFFHLPFPLFRVGVDCLILCWYRHSHRPGHRDEEVLLTRQPRPPLSCRRPFHRSPARAGRTSWSPRRLPCATPARDRRRPARIFQQRQAFVPLAPPRARRARPPPRSRSALGHTAAAYSKAGVDERRRSQAVIVLAIDPAREHGLRRRGPTSMAARRAGRRRDQYRRPNLGRSARLAEIHPPWRSLLEEHQPDAMAL